MIGEKYRIIKEAGAGGGGRIFKVYDCKLDKIWAAKRIDQKMESLEEQVLQSVEALYFVRIVDRIEQEGEVFLIMDWVDGESLQQRIDRQGALPVSKAVGIGIAVCTALEQLHTMEPPVLYLDCKPSNIMLGQDGRVLLVDFGSAVRCDEKRAIPIAASPGYAAPEQHRQGNLRWADQRSDIYGLGKTLYAALGGQCPDRPPYGALPLRRVNAAVPTELVRIVEKCCEERPEKRFQTAAALRMALKGYGKIQRRRTWIWRGIGAVILCMLLASAWELASAILQMSSVGHLKRGMIWLTAAWALQWTAGKHFDSRGPKWEMKESVLRTMKKQGIWILPFLLLFWLSPLPGWAASEDSGQLFGLRDEQFRKLLVREGAVLEAVDSIFIELDPELFEKGQVYEISVTGMDEAGKETALTFLFGPG